MSEPNVPKYDFGYNSGELMGYTPKGEIQVIPHNSSFTMSFRDDSNTGQCWTATGTYGDLSCKGYAIASITSYEPMSYISRGDEIARLDHKNKKVVFLWGIEAPNIPTSTQIIQPINIIKNLQPSEIPNMKTDIFLFDWTFAVALMLGMFVRQVWKFIWKTYCIGKILSMRERK